MNRLFLTLLLALTLLSAQTANGQILDGLGLNNDAVSVSIEPERPAPNQIVRVTIESYATDLNGADIAWFVNDKLASSAVGKKTFSLKVGRAGSVSNILIAIKTSSGAIVRKTLSIRPASVELVTEAQSYTPPFYKGRALYSFQGAVKVVAIPTIVTEDGAVLSGKNLIYNWKVGDKVRQDSSGYGKNSIIVTGGIPIKPSFVEVEVSSTDSAFVAYGSISITPSSPQTLLYEDSPLYGVLYNKALSGNITLKNAEIKIAAIPYFFDVANRTNPKLKYDWRINGEKAGAEGSSVAFRQEEKSESGEADVTLQVSNSSKIFQFGNNRLSLSFGNKETVGAF